MIIKRKHIHRVLRDAKVALMHQADTAFSPDKLVSPAEIAYLNTDIALPRQLFDSATVHPDPTYNIPLLINTLEMIRDLQLPAYLQKLVRVEGNDQLINVGAVVRKRAVDKRLQKNRTHEVAFKSNQGAATRHAPPVPPRKPGKKIKR